VTIWNYRTPRDLSIDIAPREAGGRPIRRRAVARRRRVPAPLGRSFARGARRDVPNCLPALSRNWDNNEVKPFASRSLRLVGERKKARPFLARDQWFGSLISILVNWRSAGAAI
jgi:hypothetical protein